MPHIIVQMDLPGYGVCIQSIKTRPVCELAAKHEQSTVETNLPTYHFP